MRVIYTGQSIISLEESLDFAIKEQELTQEKASELKSRLFDRADSLALNPYKGQREGYLQHLKEEIEELLKVILRSSTKLRMELSTSQIFLIPDKILQK